MARLFITEREINLISDLTKELNKDIVGEEIYIYRVREDLTIKHDVYEESINKIFDPPIKITARIEWKPPTYTTSEFGHDESDTVIFYLHQRDLLDKELDVTTGDYCQYGGIFYEITSAIDDNHVFGQIDHITGIKCSAKQSRDGQILEKLLGPIGEGYTPEELATRRVFVQQRGFISNKDGLTNDVRELQKEGRLDPPLTGPAEVSELGDTEGGSSFYGDDD